VPYTLATQPKVVITRFSFIGNSGWKIPVEDREKILFDPSRLELRLWLFERITVASLLAQTDQNFHHYILTSDQLPDWALLRLTAICQSAYPGGRFTIAPRPVGNARKFLRLFMESLRIEGPVVQIVLDDDDGLASDFMATVAEKLTVAGAEGSLAPEKLPHFVSFSKGYGLVFAEGGSRVPEVFSHRYPFINLGLTMVNGPSASNILAIDHLAAPKKAGCVPVGGVPMFVRSVHAFNDSRVTRTERWKPVAGGLADPELAPRFPYLARLLAGA
jgi:hypothetical protein